MHAQSLSRVRFFETPWTVACQAPLSMGFSRQECWNGFPFPIPGDLPNRGIEALSPVPPTLTGGFLLLNKLRCPYKYSQRPNLTSEQQFANPYTAAAAAKSLQSCLTLCNPIDHSPTGSPVPGILQARILEWVAIFFSQCMKVKREREVAQSCLTLSNPMDRSLPGSSVHGMFQARVLEWGAIAFSNPYTRQPILIC